MSRYRIIQRKTGGLYRVQERFLFFWMTWNDGSDPDYGGPYDKLYETLRDAEVAIHSEIARREATNHDNRFVVVEEI